LGLQPFFFKNQAPSISLQYQYCTRSFMLHTYKHHARWLALTASIGLLSACSSTQMRKQEIGTAAGAVVGGIVGSSVTGGSTAGTVAGAAGGALLGNQIGKQLDKVK
jgi:osmotically inducible lipoprotein OsmB